MCSTVFRNWKLQIIVRKSTAFIQLVKLENILIVVFHLKTFLSLKVKTNKCKEHVPFSELRRLFRFLNVGEVSIRISKSMWRKYITHQYATILACNTHTRYMGNSARLCSIHTLLWGWSTTSHFLQRQLTKKLTRAWKFFGLSSYVYIHIHTR